MFAAAEEGTINQLHNPKPLSFFAAGGMDSDMDALLESIALRDAAALENAFYDLKGQAPPPQPNP